MKINILTFDIEEWFHVFENHNNNISRWSTYQKRLPYGIDKILCILEEFDVKATFFCIGWIADVYPEIIRKISTLNYEIGSHSYYHKLAHSQSCIEFTKDFIDSLKVLEDLTGRKIKSYRAPGFSINESNDWVFDILIDNGIENDCSVFPIRRDFGGFEGLNINEPFIIKRSSGLIHEFPMSYSLIPGTKLKLIYSGGGFFRILPYQIIRRLISNSDYVMTYFHVRDFDRDQPFNELGFSRRIKSQVGVKKSLNKLRKLLNDYKFIDISQASSATIWTNKKQITL